MDLEEIARERNLFSVTTTKSIQEFIRNSGISAPKFDFGVRQVFDMKEEYKEHSVSVDDDF